METSGALLLNSMLLKQLLVIKNSKALLEQKHLINYQSARVFIQHLRQCHDIINILITEYW